MTGVVDEGGSLGAPLPPDSSNAGEIMLIQVEEKFAHGVRMDQHWDSSHTLAGIISEPFGKWVENVALARGYLLLAFNGLGNFLIILSLCGLIPLELIWLFVLAALPFVFVFLLGVNLHILKMLAGGFEFWFLQVLMILYLGAMADVFNFDQRCFALFLWFFGFNVFFTMDAGTRPKAVRSPAKIAGCLGSLFMWGSLIVLSTTGKFVDLHPRTIKLHMSTDVAPTIHTLVFANQRLSTLLVFVAKNAWNSFRSPECYTTIKSRLKCGTYTRAEYDDIVAESVGKRRATQVATIASVDSKKKVSVVSPTQ
jgi:hypothetical protein